MCDIKCQHYVFRRTYKTASRPTGCNGIVVLLDDYGASKYLSYCNRFKFVWRGEIKLMGLCEYLWDIKCQLNVFRRTYKTAARPSASDEIVVLLDGYDAS